MISKTSLSSREINELLPKSAQRLAKPEGPSPVELYPYIRDILTALEAGKTRIASVEEKQDENDRVLVVILETLLAIAKRIDLQNVEVQARFEAVACAVNQLAKVETVVLKRLNRVLDKTGHPKSRRRTPTRRTPRQAI